MKQHFARSVFTLLILLAVAASAQITGDIQINVSDPSGAAIPKATVTVTNPETGVTRAVTTDDTGSARVSQLGIGRYEVKISHDGFTTSTATAQVVSGGVATVPVTLNIASATQQVQVEAESSPVNTVNAQLQTTVGTSTIIDFPLVSTGVLGLAATAPGVIPVTPNNPFLGLGSYNSNGGRGRGNNITLDNATSTDVSTTGSAGLGTVPMDAIKEFNLITNQFTAEYGRNANSQLQIITKSGANDFHGELFEFHRNNYFNARDYFDRSGSATPNINNNWGAMAGGRIIKNKLFYFGTYEQQTIRGLGGIRVATVPTPTQLAGASPIAQQIIRDFAVPTSPTGTVSVSAPNATDSLAFSGRVDANLTSRDYFYARFGEQSNNASSAGLTWINSNLPQNGATSTNRTWNGTLSETHTFGPTAVNTFLAAFGRSAPVFAPLFSNGGPQITFGDATSFFGTWAGLPQGRIQNTYQFQDTFSWVRGKHQFKFGGELNRVQANSFFDNNVRGTLNFTNLNDFLAGNAFQYTQNFGNSVRGNRVWNEFFFVQDDWRVTRNLTVNLGFREEVAHGPTEVNDILSNLDPSLRTPLGGAGTGPLGSFYTGGSYFNTNYNHGPRIGFAWNPKGGKTVIRGGYGITYDFIYLNPVTNGRFLPPFMYTFTQTQAQFTGANSITGLLARTAPFQAQGASVVGTFGTNIVNFGNVTYIDPDLKNPQYQQYSLTVERQLFERWLVRASYSGSKGTYLQRTQPLNFMRAGLFTAPQSLAEQQSRQAAGEFATLNSRLSGNATTQSSRIDPRFNAVSIVTGNANSNYNSLQFFVDRRFADWYGFSVAYTWSKSMDDVSDALGVLAGDTPAQQNPLNNRDNRSVSQFDVPHRAVITHMFQSRAKRLSNPALRWALDGWEFAGIFQAQSGQPVNLLAGTVAGLADGTLLGGNGALRPDLIGPLNLQFTASSGGTNPTKIPGSGLAQPLIGHFGTLGRNVIRINPLIQSDMTVGRSFRFTERFSFKLQAQVFNVFNNTVFSQPGLTLSAPATFGYYQATDTNSRRIALTARLIW